MKTTHEFHALYLARGIDLTKCLAGVRKPTFTVAAQRQIYTGFLGVWLTNMLNSDKRLNLDKYLNLDKRLMVLFTTILLVSICNISLLPK